MHLFSSLALSLVLLAPLVAAADPVNINTADARTLDKELKGVGPARAEAIVAYRTKNGLFKSADELALVKGIPQKVIDDNRSNIRLERLERGAAPAQTAPKASPARSAERAPSKPPAPH